MLRDLSCWVVSDGKAGDELQCLAVVQALGLDPQVRRVAPRAPFSWLMPRGPIDPREAPSRPGSPIAPPYPDLLIASGRRAVPYLRAVKRASGGATFTVFLKDPRTGPRTADLIWVPAHDRLRGPNVIATLTPPHRVGAARLAAERAQPDPRLAAVPAPRAAVLVGGDSRHHRFLTEDGDRLIGNLTRLARSGTGLMITASRRTPPALRERLEALARETGGFLWDGSGENPYAAMLALAQIIVVTADSANMVGEATVTGVPVLVFHPTGGHRKLDRLVKELERYGAVRPFRGQLESFSYEPLDSTPVIADAIRTGLARHRAGVDHVTAFRDPATSPQGSQE